MKCLECNGKGELQKPYKDLSNQEHKRNSLDAESNSQIYSPILFDFINKNSVENTKKIICSNCNGTGIIKNNTMELKKYTTLTQKRRYFKSTKVLTNEDFEKLVIKKTFKSNAIYRGVNESAFRMYNSLQRSILDLDITKKYESGQKFFESYLDKAKTKHKDIFENYFKAINLFPVADVAVLSFLQHHSAPTPFLDWTKSFETALFFAIDNLDEKNVTNDEEDCNNFITVYKIDEEKLRENILEYELYKELERCYDYISSYTYEQAKKEDPTLDPTTLPREMLQHFAEQMFNETYREEYLSIDYLMKKKICYLNDFSKLNSYNLYTLNNFNIVNQNGGFIFNYDLENPLEKVIWDIYEDDIIESFEIHKKFKNRILEYLTVCGIHHDYIYPNAYKIAKNIEVSFFNAIPKKQELAHLSFTPIGTIQNEWRCKYCGYRGDFEQEHNGIKVSNLIKCPKCERKSDVGDEESVKGWFDTYKLHISNFLSYGKKSAKVKVGGTEILLKAEEDKMIDCCGDDLILMFNPEIQEYYASKSVFYLKCDSGSLDLNISGFSIDGTGDGSDE